VLYGLDVRGPPAFPTMRVHYWKNVLEFLRNAVGAEVFVTFVPPCVPPSTSRALNVAPTAKRPSSNALRSSTAPSPRAYTVASRT
jgi:hypothetical protein